MRGRLEYEIRLLPPVLACSVDDEVVVLVGPGFDPRRVEAQVRDLTRRAGVLVPVRVLAAADPQPAGLGERLLRSRPVVLVRRRPALGAAVLSSALLAASGIFVGLGSAPSSPTPPGAGLGGAAPPLAAAPWAAAPLLEDLGLDPAPETPGPASGGTPSGSPGGVLAISADPAEPAVESAAGSSTEGEAARGGRGAFAVTAGHGHHPGAACRNGDGPGRRLGHERGRGHEESRGLHLGHGCHDTP